MMPKRFVAGAVCPRCAEMDRIVTFETEGGVFKECVSCGYSEQQLAQVEVKELDTRVNSDEISASEIAAEVQVVKFMPGSQSKKS